MILHSLSILLALRAAQRLWPLHSGAAWPKKAMERMPSLRWKEGPSFERQTKSLEQVHLVSCRCLRKHQGLGRVFTETMGAAQDTKSILLLWEDEHVDGEMSVSF